MGNFVKYVAKSAVTLLTPEPTGGVYCEPGFDEFMRRYGYPDKNGKVDRLNFGGIYACTKAVNPNTGLRLHMIGYDEQDGKITDLNGGLALLDQQDNQAAFWKFTGIIEHWNRKHAQAAYVPSMQRAPPPQYVYGSKITLCEGTDLGLFLNAVAGGMVYLDPALKIEIVEGKPKPKKRNQFRIKHADLPHMYHRIEEVEL